MKIYKVSFKLCVYSPDTIMGSRGGDHDEQFSLYTFGLILGLPVCNVGRQQVSFNDCGVHVGPSQDH